MPDRNVFFLNLILVIYQVRDVWDYDHRVESYFDQTWGGRGVHRAENVALWFRAHAPFEPGQQLKYHWVEFSFSVCWDGMGWDGMRGRGL